MKTKKCPRCGKIKSTNHFTKNKNHKDKLSCYCRECSNECIKQHFKNPEHKKRRSIYYKNYAEKNREKINKRNYGYRLKNPEHYNQLRVKYYRDKKIKAIKYLGNKCLKCGIEYNDNNACIFQFHHREPSEKEMTSGELLPHCWEIIKKEIDKCDLLCANCHFMKHNNF